MTKLTITHCGKDYRNTWRYGLYRASLTDTTTLTIKGVVAYFKTKAEAKRTVYHHKLLTAMILTAVLSFFLGMLGMSGSAEKVIGTAIEFYGGLL